MAAFASIGKHQFGTFASIGKHQFVDGASALQGTRSPSRMETLTSPSWWRDCNVFQFRNGGSTNVLIIRYARSSAMTGMSQIILKHRVKRGSSVDVT